MSSLGNTALKFMNIRLARPKTDGLALLIVVALVALLFRAGGVGYVTDSLFADDSFVFINPSLELGIRSLWMPYAGYYFLYQRIIALLASCLPLVVTPYIFLGAWLTAFLSVAWVLHRHARNVGLADYTIAFLVGAIAIQPNAVATSFFFLNASHFFLGTALALYICIPGQKPHSVLDLIFLVVASLSGPFSALMIPILAVQLIVLRDFLARKETYVIVTICGIVQAISIVASQRLNRGGLTASMDQWMDAIGSVFFFGTSNMAARIGVVMFWGIAVLFLIQWVIGRERCHNRAMWLSPLLAAAAAISMYVVAALAISPSELSELSALNELHSRYFIFPCSLVFYAALVCTRGSKIAQLSIACLISGICLSTFKTVPTAKASSNAEVFARVHLQWIAYSKFQRVKPGLAIPINPQWPMYPPFWNVRGKEVGDSTTARGDEYHRLISIGAERADGEFDPQADVGGEKVTARYFDIREYCTESNYLALEVEIWRSRMGWARVSWGEPGLFDSSKSIERFYPEGFSVMQFAFRRDLSDFLVRLDPAEGVEDSGALSWLSRPKVKQVFENYGVTVAHRTKPGGEAKIREIRLFCLE